MIEEGKLVWCYAWHSSWRLAFLEGIECFLLERCKLLLLKKGHELLVHFLVAAVAAGRPDPLVTSRGSYLTHMHLPTVYDLSVRGNRLFFVKIGSAA